MRRSHAQRCARKRGVVTTKRQDLICDEIAHHIEAGKLVTKVALG
nr:recombination-associated protein RdgC [Enterobacter asburiae]